MKMKDLKKKIIKKIHAIGFDVVGFTKPNVDEITKKKYLEQANKATMQFLLPAIDKANDCDLKYRSSKNQRLLVELTLMQIASITFDGAKKKSSNYIIPATFFTSLSPKIKYLTFFDFV